MIIDYTFSTTTTNADPGNGIVRLNNATQNIASAIYIDLLDINAVDLTTLLNAFDASSSLIKANLRLAKKTDDTKWLSFDITGKTSHSGYFEFAITNTASSAANPFANSDELLITWERVGDRGAIGSTGAAGSGGAIPGLIVGMQPLWTSTTVLGAGSGSVYIESLGGLLAGSPADITPSSPSASTWYHVYVYSGSGALGGTPTLEASTTGPVAFATPAGFARSKSGDTSRRYLYSAKTDGSGLFYRFACDQSGLFRWLAQQLQGSPFRVLSNGTQNTSTAVDCSAVVPPTARTIYLQLQNLATDSRNVYVGSADYAVTASAFELELGLATTAIITEVTGFVGCSSSQNINYMNGTGSGAPSAYINVFGFLLQR